MTKKSVSNIEEVLKLTVKHEYNHYLEEKCPNHMYIKALRGLKELKTIEQENKLLRENGSKALSLLECMRDYMPEHTDIGFLNQIDGIIEELVKILS